MHQARTGTHRGTRALNDPANNPGANRADKRRRDFGIIGRAQQASAAAFVSRLPLRSGQRLLDVSCGTGIASIPAARQGADVTGVDPREPFLSRGRAWAKNENLLIRFKPAVPEQLPFSDGNFHAVLNFMGLPFARHPAAAVGEMQRVCRKDGLLAVTAWEPSSLVGTMFHVAYQYTGDDHLKRAIELSEPGAIEGLFTDAFVPEQTEVRTASFEYPLAPAEIAACFLLFHTSLEEAAAELEPDARNALSDELTALWEEASESAGDLSRAHAQYRELILTRA